MRCACSSAGMTVATIPNSSGTKSGTKSNNRAIPVRCADRCALSLSGQWYGATPLPTSILVRNVVPHASSACEVVSLILAHAAGKTQLPAGRQLVWLLLQSPNKLSSAAKGGRDELLRAPETRSAYPLIQTFFAMIRDRRARDLVNWIAFVRRLAAAQPIPSLSPLRRDFNRISQSCMQQPLIATATV